LESLVEESVEISLNVYKNIAEVVFTEEPIDFELSNIFITTESNWIIEKDYKLEILVLE